MKVLVLYLILCVYYGNAQSKFIKRPIPIGILVPFDAVDGQCTKKAIKMAVSDINAKPNFIVNAKTRKTYYLQPYIKETSDNVGDSIEALHVLYKKPVKLSTIGPPYKDQNEYCAEYSTAQANLHISYSEANEPMETYFIFYYQTPPSITSGFFGASALMRKYNWTQAGVIYDYSDKRYRKNADNLREILTRKDDRNMSRTVLTDQGIWSVPVKYSVSEEMKVLQTKGARIIFALVSVNGARKVFCEAYRQKMYRPTVIWILFEILPDGWASDKYNAFTTADNRKEREISCTEEELLTAADGYIAVTKQGLRKDNKRTISNMTSDDFRKRLQKEVGPNVICDENVAYAYDAMWVLAKGYQNGARFLDLDTYRFYHNFPFGLKLTRMYRAVKFEALTGPLKYSAVLSTIISRIGQVSIWVNNKGEKAKYVGTHDTDKDDLQLIPNVTHALFGSTIVPKDHAVYSYQFADFSQSLLIIMWLISFLGIIMAVLFLIATLTFMSDKNISLDSPLINCTILIGSILCYGSVIVYGIDTRYVSEGIIPKMCSLFVWSLSIGFTLTFGALFAKTWQLYKIYMTPDTKMDNHQPNPKNVPEWLLFIIIGVFLLIDVIALLSWQFASPFTEEIVEVSKTLREVIEVEQIVRCDCTYKTQFTIGLYCYKGILLIFGIFLAWQTRNAKVKIQNESKQIAMAIYNVVAVSVIGVICVSVLANTTRFQALYAIVAVCICICTTTTLLLVFLNKIKKLLNSDGASITSDKSEIGSKESPPDRFSLDYMRKRMGSRGSEITNGTISTQVSTESQLQPMSMPSMNGNSINGPNGSVVSISPSYLTSSSFTQPPPDYEANSEVSRSEPGDSRLRSGIYVGTISEEGEEVIPNSEPSNGQQDPPPIA